MLCPYLRSKINQPFRHSRNVSILLPIILVVTLGISDSYAQGLPIRPDSLSLFEFGSAKEASWRVVNDGVMGGRSKGFVSLEDGTLKFTGTLVTRGGGFTSLRAAMPADLSTYDGLELRVRGNGRTFEVEVSDGARLRGRSVSRRAAFKTTDEWNVVRVPFSSLRSTVFGQSVNVKSIDLSKVDSFGLYIADGVDGAFRLEVDNIRAYRLKDKSGENS